MITTYYTERIAQTIIEDRAREAAMYNSYTDVKPGSTQGTTPMRSLLHLFHKMRSIKLNGQRIKTLRIRSS